LAKIGHNNERERIKREGGNSIQEKIDGEKERVGGRSSILICYLPLGPSDGREERWLQEFSLSRSLTLILSLSPFLSLILYSFLLSLSLQVFFLFLSSVCDVLRGFNAAGCTRVWNVSMLHMFY